MASRTPAWVLTLAGGCVLAVALTVGEGPARRSHAGEQSNGRQDLDSRVTSHSVNVAALSRVITGYFYAIGENRLDEAMSFYHDDSPQLANERETREFARTAYLQRTTTLAMELVHHDDEQAVVVAAHRHLKIAGVKFMSAFAQTRYVLRRQDDTWKIWTKTERPLRASPPNSDVRQSMEHFIRLSNAPRLH